MRVLPLFASGEQAGRGRSVLILLIGLEILVALSALSYVAYPRIKTKLKRRKREREWRKLQKEMQQGIAEAITKLERIFEERMDATWLQAQGIETPGVKPFT